MKLQQLKYIREIARRGLSISAAAQALYASQPGVSNQVQALETELGLKIFERHGKRLTGITAVGESVLETAERVLQEVENLKALAADSRHEQKGTLCPAGCHSEIRSRLSGCTFKYGAGHTAGSRRNGLIGQSGYGHCH